MAFTAVSNFTGKSAGFYISAALKQAVSLDYLTTIENIKFKSNIQKMDATVTPVALQMRAGAGAPPPASFDDYVISYMGEIIADATETSIWAGVANAGGDFIGFTGAGAAGWLRAGNDATVIQGVLTGGAGVAPVVGTIVADMQVALDATPAAVIGKEDLHIYVNQKNYQLYIQAISALGYLNAYNMQSDYVPLFNGIKWQFVMDYKTLQS